MLRSLLVGLLVAGVASCKHEGGAVEVVPGAPAGKVVEVVGAVTASRGGATRPLAVGDTVAADDEVATPADGRVAIELAHNGARWELGAGKRKRVADSLAWNQARAEGPSRGELATTAAGRPAEKAAAEGAASAKADHETAPAEEDGKRPRTAIGSPTPEPTAASVDQVPAPPEPTTTRVTKTPATPPPKPKPDRQEAKTEAKPPTLQPAPLGGVPGHRGADKAVDGPLDSSGGGPTETIAKDDAPGASRRTIAQATPPSSAPASPTPRPSTSCSSSTPRASWARSRSATPRCLPRSTPASSASCGRSGSRPAPGT
jgi:hypothetical protein